MLGLGGDGAAVPMRCTGAWVVDEVPPLGVRPRRSAPVGMTRRKRPRRPALLLFGIGIERARRAIGAARDGLAEGRRRVAAFIDPAENHFAGRCLMDGGDQDVHGLVDEAACAIDDNHGAVFKIGNALIYFLAFAEDKDAHAFSGENSGAKSVGQKVDVENVDALNTGDFIEVEIVGNDFGLEAESEFDQFAVDFADLAGSVFDDADF